MAINGEDFTFTIHLVKFMMIESPEWRPGLAKYLKDQPDTPFTISISEKMRHTLTINNYHVKFNMWFEGKELIYKNFKMLAELLTANFLKKDYEEVTFLDFCIEIANLGYCGYLLEIDEAPDCSILCILHILKSYRERGQFMNDSFEKLDNWAMEVMRGIEKHSPPSPNYFVDEHHSDSISDSNSSGFESDTPLVTDEVFHEQNIPQHNHIVVPNREPNNPIVVPNRFPTNPIVVPNRFPTNLIVVPNRFPTNLIVVPNRFPTNPIVVPNRFPTNPIVVPNRLPSNPIVVPNRFPNNPKVVLNRLPTNPIVPNRAPTNPIIAPIRVPNNRILVPNRQSDIIVRPSRNSSNSNDVHNIEPNTIVIHKREPNNQISNHCIEQENSVAVINNSKASGISNQLSTCHLFQITNSFNHNMTLTAKDIGAWVKSITLPSEQKTNSVSPTQLENNIACSSIPSESSEGSQMCSKVFMKHNQEYLEKSQENPESCSPKFPVHKACLPVVPEDGQTNPASETLRTGNLSLNSENHFKKVERTSSSSSSGSTKRTIDEIGEKSTDLESYEHNTLKRQKSLPVKEAIQQFCKEQSKNSIDNMETEEK